MKKRSELGLGSAFFGISDPGLVKKTFFKVFFDKKLTGGPGDEMLEISVLRGFSWVCGVGGAAFWAKAAPHPHRV